MEQRNSPRAGFTIMELVTVLALMGLIAVLAVGGYAGYQAAMQDRTAKDVLLTLQDAYLYSRTTEQTDDGAVAKVPSLVSEELEGAYRIILKGDSYRIEYDCNGKTYILENGQFSDTTPDVEPETPEDHFTGLIYDDMYKLIVDLDGMTPKEKRDYMEAHGHDPKTNSFGNSTYRNFLFEVVYKDQYGGWPPMSEEFLEKWGIRSGEYYIQPYIGTINGENTAPLSSPDNVIVFANDKRNAVNNWNANFIYFDSVWYYSSKSKSVVYKTNEEYEALKAFVTTNWRPLVEGEEPEQDE